jgi:iron complex transport system ATP-binding protein
MREKDGINPMHFIEIGRLSFSYRRMPFIRELNLKIDQGGIVALLGPNGSGKTTLLKLILGLLKPMGGFIRLQGKEIKYIPQRELACRLAYIPQIHREAFGYSVFDVVLMGRMPHTSFFSRYSAKDMRIAWESLEKLSIGHLAGQPYTEISGGERQLTLIARALSQGAATFIMDEPTNALDYGNQIRLLEKIGRLASEGFTFLYTTHHPDHALAIADRVVMMKAGMIIREGEPCATITPEGLSELYGLANETIIDQSNHRFGMPQFHHASAQA